MGFENAYITAAEYFQYGLADIDKRYEPMMSCSSDWTIDREHGMHMRSASRVVPPDSGPKGPYWLFFWKTGYVIFECEVIQPASEHNNWTAHKRLSCIELPEHLALHKVEIIRDIESALIAWGTGGVYCKAKDFKLVFHANV